MVQTKGGEAEALLDQMLRFMDDRHALIGAYPRAAFRNCRRRAKCHSKGPRPHPTVDQARLRAVAGAKVGHFLRLG